MKRRKLLERIRSGSHNNYGGRLIKEYHINIFYSEEDGCFVADIPDLEYCSAFGDTTTEALREVEKAKKAWLKAARQEKKPVPPPSYRPVICQVSK